MHHFKTTTSKTFSPFTTKSVISNSLVACEIVKTRERKKKEEIKEQAKLARKQAKLEKKQLKLSVVSKNMLDFSIFTFFCSFFLCVFF